MYPLARACIRNPHTQSFSYDLTFDWYGYTLVFINNCATAANGVYIKKMFEAKVGASSIVGLSGEGRFKTSADLNFAKLTVPCG
jgi:hypothetical protein